MKKKFRVTAAAAAAAMLLSASPVQAFAAGTQATTETLRTELRTAWKNLSSTVSMQKYHMTIDELSDVYYDLLYTEGDWFYVGSGFNYSTNPDGTVAGIVLSYNYSKSEIPAMIRSFNQKITEIGGMVNSNWSDAEKVLFLHDYLAEHCQYDLTYVACDAYAAMIGGTAICQGYALAMCVLCRSLDIPCYAITSDEINHMWNVVQVDGKWYQVDVTFDDSAPDLIGHADHTYVLRSDAAMMADPEHKADDWNYFTEGQTISCDSERFADAFWVNSVDTIQPLSDGSWVFGKLLPNDQIMYSDQICSTISVCSPDGTVTPLRTIQQSWTSPTGGSYITCYVCSQVYGDKIYYHTDQEIRCMALDGSNDQLVYTLTSAEKALGSIFGILIDGNGLLTYQIQSVPSFESDHTVANLTFHTLQLSAAPVTTTTPTATSSTSTTKTTTITTTTKPVTTTATTVLTT
ncbi:MAG TPA: hypothetical protein DCG49_12630, partial [Ruminococcus sp.]|nr:hypothetical protein [Ruminococcus sp.]